MGKEDVDLGLSPDLGTVDDSSGEAGHFDIKEACETIRQCSDGADALAAAQSSIRSCRDGKQATEIARAYMEARKGFWDTEFWNNFRGLFEQFSDQYGAQEIDRIRREGELRIQELREKVAISRAKAEEAIAGLPGELARIEREGQKRLTEKLAELDRERDEKIRRIPEEWRSRSLWVKIRGIIFGK